MVRKTFIIFWSLSLVPLIGLGALFYWVVGSEASGAIWLVGIGCAILLGLLTGWITSRLIRPLDLDSLQQAVESTATVAEELAQGKWSSKPSSPLEQAAWLGRTLEKMADDVNETQHTAESQAGRFQDQLLALTQFGRRVTNPDLAEDIDHRPAEQTAILPEQKVIQEALEVTIRHLGCDYAAIYLQAHLAQQQADLQAEGEKKFVLFQALSSAGAARNMGKLENLILPAKILVPINSEQPQNNYPVEASAYPGASQSEPANMLVAAIRTRQAQIDRHPAWQAFLPLVAAGEVIGAMQAVYLAGELVDAEQPTDVEETLRLSALQITSTLLGLGVHGLRKAIPSKELPVEQKARGPEANSLLIHKTGETDGEEDAQIIHRRLAELESLWKISQAIALETELNKLYELIHTQLTEVMGEIGSFAIVFYDKASNRLNIPYMVEDGQAISVPPFPLGQGLSSIVIRTGRPLLLAHSSAEKASELGAIFVGQPAKSWLGVPLALAGETFGLIIAQDTHQEGRFGEEDERLLSLVAAQVALVVRNARLIDEIRRQAQVQQEVIQISNQLRRSMDMESILKTTAQSLASALKARQARVRLSVSAGSEHPAGSESPAEPTAPDEPGSLAGGDRTNGGNKTARGEERREG
jgi:GAF domain-containing protein